MKKNILKDIKILILNYFKDQYPDDSEAEILDLVRYYSDDDSERKLIEVLDILEK